MDQTSLYTNPILPGLYPDPSVCRVGKEYYLVTSSFAYFPGVPIFHSRDLIHWQQIGHCLTRDSQLPLAGVGSSGGIFAPTLRYHQGIFYMITTNVSYGGNFYIFSDDPAGEWSEPHFVEQGGIDPSLCFDEEHVYLTSTGASGGIAQCKIDIKSGKQLTETRPTWSGTGGRYPEGPHLYHIGAYYYLMIAEGGTEYGHMETLARSQNPWGPFEPCPHNPILTHRDQAANPIQGTGHADLIEAHDGSWWLVFLGFRTPAQYQQYHHLGRETFLAPVTWSADGWPLIAPDKTVQLQMETATLPQHPWHTEPERDDFAAPDLRLCWNFLRNPDPGSWSLSERPGWLRLYGTASTLNDLASPAFMGRRQQHFACDARALLNFVPAQEGDEAGLTVLMDEQHHYEIAVTRLEGRMCMIVRRRIGDLTAIVATETIEAGTVELAIQARADTYVFSYTLPGQEMRELAHGSARYLSSEVAGGFTGVYLGIYATGNGHACSNHADFDWFEYHPCQ